MGLHTAEPHLSEGGYVGVGVHRAARVCAAGHGGQILLSAATAGVIEDLDIEGVGLRDLGEHRLKDLVRPQRMFQLEVEGLPSEFPGLKTVSGTNVLGTLLMTDLVGWTTLLRVLGDEVAVAAASRYNSIIVRAAEMHGGRALELIGDHALAFFERPRDAVRAALAAREAVRHDPWVSDEHRCALKCGIHSGRLVSVQPGQLGSAAPYVIRLCETAEPWQILVSHATEALLEGDAPEFHLEDLGERTLPGRDRPERVFSLPI
jgi:class 3 adenylate cyclase